MNIFENKDRSKVGQPVKQNRAFYACMQQEMNETIIRHNKKNSYQSKVYI